MKDRLAEAIKPIGDAGIDENFASVKLSINKQRHFRVSVLRRLAPTDVTY